MQEEISIKDLRKVYKTGTAALKGVTLSIEKGDFFALLGPNGAGKTTLIGILAGLVVKTGGEVSVFGSSIDKDPVTTKSHIGLVPQEFNFNIFEKVIDIVVDQAGFYGIPRKEALARAENILKDLGLWEKRNEPSQQLSGGMKRRLMIARALIHHPRLLLLDEPTAGVDVEMRHGMWDFLRKMNQGGMTIVLTTHYLEEAEKLSRTVAMINKGEIVLNEPMAGLLARHGGKKLENIYLDLIKQDNEQPS
ncbi:MAG: antibiotic transport system ATP-binding protein [Parcubacteria group bacterium Gr01-1014_56]|nr:MAG: antibiotic transport system ATP-binding protein [Parcubacteria group bacterium Gr01-1014_56]